MSFNFEPHLRISSRSGSQIHAHVPWRQDKNPSFSADSKTGLWTDHGKGESGNWSDFCSKLGLEDETKKPRVSNNRKVFTYKTQAGKEILQVNRTDYPGGKKKFYQKHKKGDEWLNGGYFGHDLQPYRMDEVSVDQIIYFVEGEKCADSLWARGVAATTVPGGTGGWKEQFAKCFSSRHVIILPDNDKVGKEYAARVYESLVGIAASVKIIELSNLREGEDIVDWLAKGNTIEDLKALHISPTTQECSRVLRMSDVEPENVEWLWDDRIPLGFLTMITGDPGVGKSFLVAAMMGSLTRGESLPPEKKLGEAKKCLYYTVEDSPAHTIRPRLDKCSADPKFCYVHPHPLAIDATGLSEIRRDIEKTQASLVVIDPIIAYLKENTDMHRANEVRANLMNLAVIARETQTAIVCIRHMNKGGEGQKAIYRGQGSIDFVAAVRSELMVFSSVSDPSLRYLAHIKCNLALKSKIITYRLEQDNFTWGEELEESLEEIESKNIPKQTRAKGSPCLDAAMDFLRQSLDELDVPATEVIDGAIQNGITKGNLLRAKKALGVESIKLDDIWFWKKIDPERASLVSVNSLLLNESLDEMEHL